MASNQIEIAHGRLKNTSFADLENLFQSYLSNPEMNGKPIVIYLHGGGIKKKKIVKQIKNHFSKTVFLESECFPLYLLWHSGIGEVFIHKTLDEFKAKYAKKDAESVEGLLEVMQFIFEKLTKSKRFNKILKVLLKKTAKKIKAGASAFESATAAFESFEVLENEPIENEELIAKFRQLESFAGTVNDYSKQEIEELEAELKEDGEVDEANPIGSEFEAFALFKMKLIREIVQILIRVVRRLVNKTHHGLLETILEELLRQYVGDLAKNWWKMLKDSVDAGFRNDPQVHGGTAILTLLDKYWDEIHAKGEVPVYIVSTSAGSLYAGKFLEAAEKMDLRPDLKFKMIYAIPAVTFKSFHQTLSLAENRIQSLEMFGMNDRRERKDQLMWIYRNSILYLVSGLLEDSVDEPILGMQRFHKNKKPYQIDKPQNRILKEVLEVFKKHPDAITWAPADVKDGYRCNGDHHQTFIVEAGMKASLRHRMIAKKKKPATPEPVSPPAVLEETIVEIESTTITQTDAVSVIMVDGKPMEKTEFLSGDFSQNWDEAYEKYAISDREEIIEPNVDMKYEFRTKESAFVTSEFESVTNAGSYDKDWPPYTDDGDKIWHLSDKFSQLSSAIEEATKDNPHTVRIAHIDTGYDPTHITYPKENIVEHLQRNFVSGENLLDATDITPKKAKLRQPGHGAGTLGILAGKAINQYGHKGPLGLTKNVEIIPIRITESVVLFKSSAFVNALRHIITLYDNPETRIHVVTMSLGGVASRKWAKVINEAYEKGIFIVTAAGNNFGRKTPHTLVYPARFNRVVAACGVTQELKPYKKRGVEKFFEMQGNFGPRKLMKTAIAAFTPNLPWAVAGTKNVVKLSGAGTSSATPQIAMAAALYRLKHWDDLEKLPEGWQQVEAIRHAMFDSAVDRINGMTKKDIELHFGNGILRAKEMLKIKVEEANLKKARKDRVIFPFFRVFLGTESPVLEVAPKELMRVELAQLTQKDAILQEILEEEEKTFDKLSKDKQLVFCERILTMSESSETLKKYVQYLMTLL